MNTLQCRRALWLIAGFLFGACVILSFRYGMSLATKRSYWDEIGRKRHITDTSANQEHFEPLPKFDGKIFKVEGPWEIVSDKQNDPKVSADLSFMKNHTVNEDESKWLEIQTQRRSDVQRYCDQHKNLKIPYKGLKRSALSQFYKTVLVGSNHQALYCPVGKVACTSWKTAIAILQGHYDGLKPGEHIHDIEVLERNNIQPLSKTESPEIMLDNYPIFIFVRHPFERLVSAFKNKFHAPNGENLQEKYGRDIIKRYRPPGKATEEELRTGWGVTFPEFIRWIIEDKVKNIHWNSFNDICHLCSVPYTFIGKMDTFTTDTKYILKNLFGAENFDKFPHSNPSPKESRVPLESYFDNVPQEHIDLLKKQYEIDFKMFNYSWPSS